MLIAACVVNHNTSPFAELALRSLAAVTRSSAAHHVEFSVLDNHSSDEGLAALEEAADELGATFQRTKWPLQQTLSNSHGDALRDFVLDTDHADAYLFVDADIVWTDPSSIETMAAELAAGGVTWAVQARFHSTERRDGPGGSLDIWAGRKILLQFSHALDQEPGLGKTLARTIRPRCHPGATLIANTSTFRGVATHLGLGTAAALGNDEGVAGFYDTLGLASQAMRAFGLRYVLSAISLIHYFNVSYDARSELTAAKLTDCNRRLQLLRTDPRAVQPSGPWGPLSD